MQRCTWKTRFFGMSSEGLFQTLSKRISYCIHIVKTSWCQLPVKSGIFCLLVEVVYWPCGLKFAHPMINLAFQGITVKFPVKFCLHNFEWFCLQISVTKYFPLLSKALWLKIDRCYHILLSNLKQKRTHYYQ